MRKLESDMALLLALSSVAPPMALDNYGYAIQRPANHKYRGGAKRHADIKSDQDLARMAAAQSKRDRRAKKRGAVDE